MSPALAGKRRLDTDVIKLIKSKHEVIILGGLDEFVVKFSGPSGIPYEGGGAYGRCGSTCPSRTSSRAHP